MLKIIKNSTFHRIVLLIVIIILFLLFTNESQEKEKYENLVNQNELAFQNKLETITSKYNTQLTKTYTYIDMTDSLENYSKELEDAIQRVKDSYPGDIEVNSSTMVDVQVNGFSGTSTNTENYYEDGFGKFVWYFNKDTLGYKRKLKGQTEYEIDIYEELVNIIPKKTTILEDNFEVRVFLTSIVNDDNSISVVAETLNENVKINQLKQTIDPIVTQKTVDRFVPRPKKDIVISWGLQVGLGSDIIRNEFTPYIGLGAQIEFGRITEFDFPKIPFINP